MIRSMHLQHITSLNWNRLISYKKISSYGFENGKIEKIDFNIEFTDKIKAQCIP